MLRRLSTRLGDVLSIVDDTPVLGSLSTHLTTAGWRRRLRRTARRRAAVGPLVLPEGEKVHRFRRLLQRQSSGEQPAVFWASCGTGTQWDWGAQLGGCLCLRVCPDHHPSVANSPADAESRTENRASARLRPAVPRLRFPRGVGGLSSARRPPHVAGPFAGNRSRPREHVPMPMAMGLVMEFAARRSILRVARQPRRAGRRLGQRRPGAPLRTRLHASNHRVRSLAPPVTLRGDNGNIHSPVRPQRCNQRPSAEETSNRVEPCEKGCLHALWEGHGRRGRGTPSQARAGTGLHQEIWRQSSQGDHFVAFTLPFSRPIWTLTTAAPDVPCCGTFGDVAGSVGTGVGLSVPSAVTTHS